MGDWALYGPGGGTHVELVVAVGRSTIRRRVALMCLHAEIATEEGQSLTLGEWLQLAADTFKPRILPA